MFSSLHFKNFVELSQLYYVFDFICWWWILTRKTVLGSDSMTSNLFVIMVFSEWGAFIKRLITRHSPPVTPLWSPAIIGQWVVRPSGSSLCLPDIINPINPDNAHNKTLGIHIGTELSELREDHYIAPCSLLISSLPPDCLGAGAGNCKISPESRGPRSVPRLAYYFLWPDRPGRQLSQGNN